MGGDEGGDVADHEDIEVQGTSTPDMPPPPPPPPPRQILQIQEPAIVKAKGRPRGASNRLWAGGAPPQSTASQRRRQQTVENSIQREPSGFELTPELPSSQVADSQLQVPDSQPQSQRGGRHEAGEGVVSEVDKEVPRKGLQGVRMQIFRPPTRAVFRCKLEVQLEVDSEHA
jgi:hypothetical protein